MDERLETRVNPVYGQLIGGLPTSVLSIGLPFGVFIPRRQIMRKYIAEPF